MTTPPASNTFYVKQGDLLPDLTTTCLDANGNPADLATAASVVFHMRLPGSTTVKVSNTASFVDRTNGIVSYTWVGTDTDTPGRYYSEFQVNFDAGGPLTFPNGTNDTVIVTEAVG